MNQVHVFVSVDASSECVIYAFMNIVYLIHRRGEEALYGPIANVRERQSNWFP